MSARSLEKNKSPVWGIDKRWKAGIMKIRGGAAGRREPPFTKRSNRTVGTVGRLLLFAVQEQVNDTNDQNADLNEIRIRDHDITPLRCSGGGTKEVWPPPERGAPAYRILAAPAHIRCARSIIAYCVGIGKTWGRILPSRALPVPPPFHKGGCCCASSARHPP